LHLTAHHNLFAHCNNRNPRFNGIRHTATEFVDYRNNVIYNWGSNNIYAGEGGNYNISNNYYKYGPNTSKSVRFRIANPGKNETIGFGKWYVNGNYVDEAEEVSSNNWLGVHMGNGGTDADKKETIVNEAFPAEAIPDQSAIKAYEQVLYGAGATRPNRDTLDRRIIQDVMHRKGRFIDVQGGFPHGTEYSLTVNAWPALKSLPAPTDTDKDGMSDEWEKRLGLNPADPSDAANYKLSKDYTNIEMYLESFFINRY
jgi:hypothetical protein